MNIPCGFPFSCSYLCLGPIEHFLELRYSMSHSGVHVCFRAFDMIMEVVSEQLNV